MQTPSPRIETRPALEALRRLEALEEERALAHLTGLTRDPDYLADLDDAVTAASHAYVGLAVTEVAALRAELDGANFG